MSTNSPSNQKRHGVLAGLVEQVRQGEPEKYATLKKKAVVVHLLLPSPWYEGVKSAYSIEWGEIYACGQSKLERGELEQKIWEDVRHVNAYGISVFVRGGSRRVPAARRISSQ